MKDQARVERDARTQAAIRQAHDRTVAESRRQHAEEKEKKAESKAARTKR